MINQLKQRQMENSTINKNQKAINFFLKRFNDTRVHQEARNNEYSEMFAAASHATNWSEWDAVVSSNYDSSTLTAWHDTEGFNFMKPRLLKKMSDKWSQEMAMYQHSIDEALAKLEELKQN